jgi:RNA polymerase sigma-70 factor, ECF subfamily
MTAIPAAVGDLRAPRGGQLPRAPADEATLMARIAGGDVGAYAALYDRMAGPVYGLARSVIRDTALAEEVTQEVLLRVWETACRFDPSRGSVRTWVLTMAHRRAVDRVRSEQSTRHRDERFARSRVAPGFDEVAEVVETRWEHSTISAALEDLTPLQRESLTLAYYGALTHQEIAHRLDIPLGTAKSRIRGALARLRVTLTTEDEHGLWMW